MFPLSIVFTFQLFKVTQQMLPHITPPRGIKGVPHAKHHKKIPSDERAVTKEGNIAMCIVSLPVIR